MTVLVAIPYWHAGPYIEQAVGCILAQTYRDLVCLVAGDGEMPPLTSKDDRLVVLSFPTNEGAPATQQAMLLGSPFEWYAPHGADDWADPEYLECLMAAEGPAKASGGVWWHYPDETVLRHGDPAMAEFGVFDAEMLRSVGGYGSEWRCGMDTLLFEKLLPTPIRWVDVDAYHKRIRADSLTRDPETGFGSEYRGRVVQAIAETVERTLGRTPEEIRDYRTALVPPETRSVLEDRIAAVQGMLA